MFFVMNHCIMHVRMRRNEHVVVQQNSSDNATAERLDISFCATLQFHVVTRRELYPLVENN